MAIMEGIVCLYKDKCTDYPMKCEQCIHNEGKKSHFKPTHEPWLEPRRPEPKRPWEPGWRPDIWYGLHRPSHPWCRTLMVQ